MASSPCLIRTRSRLLSFSKLMVARPMGVTAKMIAPFSWKCSSHSGGCNGYRPGLDFRKRFCHCAALQLHDQSCVAVAHFALGQGNIHSGNQHVLEPVAALPRGYRCGSCRLITVQLSARFNECHQIVQSFIFIEFFYFVLTKRISLILVQ